MEKMAENGRVTTHSVRSNAPIGRVSFESFMRFVPIGGEGSFLFARGTPLHFYDGGSKVTCKGPARALLASPQETEWREGEHLSCQYSPMIRSLDISSRNEVWKTLSTWKISREIFNWNG